MRGGLAERDGLQRRRSECTPGATPVPLCVCCAAATSAIGDDRGEQRERGDPARGMAHAPGQAPPRVAGQRAQHAGDLAGRLAGARGLDREHLLEVGDHRWRRRGSGRARSLATARSTTEAVAAETSGRSRCTSGTCSRTWRMATATGVSPREGDLAGEHLVEHDAERVEVGLPGDGLPERLLGGDVVGRAEHAPGDRQAFLGERAGDAEVGDLGAAFLADQDVLRLDVAVHDHGVRARRRARARSRSRRRSPAVISSGPSRRISSLSVSPSTYSSTM